MFRLILIAFFYLSCNQHAKEYGYFSSISQNDLKLTAPRKGEWRATHHETLQNCDEYKALNPNLATIGKTKLYLLPLGQFSAHQSEILELTRQYLEIFFQLKTDFLDTVSTDIIPDTAKRFNRNTHAVQLYTPYIMEYILKGKTPQDGYALMALSEKDLYPNPDWNFVFGIASYEDRIGISSLFRYQTSTDGSLNKKLLLRRLIGTASHEMGHMFSLHHCLSAKCCMNGSNSLAESDKQPLRLCSECQKKLNWNIKFDNMKRLKELIEFMRHNNLMEDLADLQQDYNSLM